MTDELLGPLCATILPGLDEDLTAGAPDVAAERYVHHYLGDEDTSTLVAALDAATPSGRFTNADMPARTAAITALRRDPSLQPLIDRAVALTLAAVYGSWSGLGDELTRAVEPLGWALTGYTGPTRTKLPAMEQ